MIELKNVSIGYNKKAILEEINVNIKKGEYVAIIGPNGAGKSTLIKTILGIIPNIKGDIIRDKELIFGYVPQSKNIPNHFPLSAFDVALMGRYKKKQFFPRVSKNDREIVKDSFKELNITDLMKMQYSELSGGQKQRVLIAKALSSKPDILILDEPTSAMDLVSKNNILTILDKLSKDKKMTIIIITHHLLDIDSSKLIFINKNNKTFFSGSKKELFTQEKLSKLYEGEIVFNHNNNFSIEVRG